jgi:hypothetical protein
MPESRFDGQPINGTQVAMINSGSKFTPYRVTVTKKGQVVRELDFASKADAQHAYDQEQKAANNAPRP